MGKCSNPICSCLLLWCHVTKSLITSYFRMKGSCLSAVIQSPSMAFLARTLCWLLWVTLTRGSEMWHSLWSPSPNPSLSSSMTLRLQPFGYSIHGKKNHKSSFVKKPERYICIFNCLEEEIYKTKQRRNIYTCLRIEKSNVRNLLFSVFDFFFLVGFHMQFTFNVIVKQVLGLTPDEPQTTRILEDFLTFMRGLISLPLYIPGTPYARAVQVLQTLYLNCSSSLITTSL